MIATFIFGPPFTFAAMGVFVSCSVYLNKHGFFGSWALYWIAPIDTKRSANKQEQPMSKKLYVGNLSFNSSEDDIRTQFSNFGEVISVNLITDRETGRLRGFGFVEMDDEGARAAIAGMDGQEFGGRNLKVNEAEDKPRSGGSNRSGSRW
jgi:RNA recognition motif-containing protein